MSQRICPLPLKQRNLPSLPHLVVLSIEVRRTWSSFLVHHLWTLDWLESRKTQIGSDAKSKTKLATREGEWMGANKNSSRRRWLLKQDEHDNQNTSLTQLPDGYQPWRCKISLITKINSCTQSKNGQEPEASNLNITRRWSLQYTKAALCGYLVVAKANW
jgi:hypothetical protein